MQTNHTLTTTIIIIIITIISPLAPHHPTPPLMTSAPPPLMASSLPQCATQQRKAILAAVCVHTVALRQAQSLESRAMAGRYLPAKAAYELTIPRADQEGHATPMHEAYIDVPPPLTPPYILGGSGRGDARNRLGTTAM